MEELDKPGVSGCTHYRRGCQLGCPSCSEFFSCRFCHDEVKFETEQEAGAPKHKLDRFRVQRVKCNACDHQQASAKSCERCGASFGKYFCAKCNLYDDDLSKEQFHCDDCGICRVGGRENFFHCETCGACYSNELKARHLARHRSLLRHHLPAASLDAAPTRTSSAHRATTCACPTRCSATARCASSLLGGGSAAE